MNERPKRLVLWLLALTVFLLFAYHGRPVRCPGEQSDFLPGGSAGQGGVTIRIEGDCIKPGIYHLKNEVPLGTVINMTVPFLRRIVGDSSTFNKKLSSGDVVTIPVSKSEHAEITRDGMPVVEKMLLGIPLDPNVLTADEWENLPRIGPSLAKRIVADRQYNGDFLAVRDLERVPGIGAVTVKQLEGYFVQDTNR
jgi:competence protein ComEA